MTSSNDSSFEMHDDSLSPEEVEHLVDGTSERPDLADVEALFAEVRALPNSVETPPVSAALAEFIGVNLTPTAEPIVLPDTAEARAKAIEEARDAEPVRRTSMIGSAAAFLGTMGGKVALGTAVAAASVGGVHATGAVDVPFLPDTKSAVIETIDVPESPDPLAFFEEVDDVAEVDEKESAEKFEDAEEKAEGKHVEEKEVEEKDVEWEHAEDDFPEPRPKVIVEDDDKDEELVEEKEIEEPKKEEPKEEPKKEEPKKDDGKSEAEKAEQAQLEALEEALHIAKDKVRADATALIKPLEEERDGLLEDLEAAHKALAEEWEPIIDQLLADLEATSDEQERAEIEEDIDAAETAWTDARVAAELEVDPRLEEIDELFHQIETERDAEIDRLIAEFLAAVEEIEKG